METNKQQEQYYSCYKYYNAKKRRLSCFGRKINENELEFWIWECDRKDKFDKKYARSTYEAWIFLRNTATVGSEAISSIHPQIFTVPLADIPIKLQFLEYLRDNYYKQFPVWKVVRYKYLKQSELEELFPLINALI